MVLKNLSARPITLRDTDGNVYTVPSLDELVLDDDLIEDDVFKRWLRWRLRDLLISPFVNIDKNGSPVDSKPTLNFVEGTNITITTTATASAIDIQIDAAADVNYNNLTNLPSTFPIAITKAGSAIGTRPKINFIEGSNITLTVADNPGSARVDVTIDATGDLSVAWDDITGKPSSFAPSGHQSAHQAGGSDMISGNLTANARLAVAKAGTTTGTRRKVNFIEGSGISITLSDDSGSEKVDVTIAATPSAPTTATYVTLSSDATLSAEAVLGTAVIMKGTAASQPATATAGKLYYITDSGSERLTRDTGSGWDDLIVDWDFVGGKPTTFAPSAHASSHISGQSDAIKLDDLATPDDNTDLNASASRHGLLPKLSGDPSEVFHGDGTWGEASNRLVSYTAPSFFSITGTPLQAIHTQTFNGTTLGLTTESRVYIEVDGYYKNDSGATRTLTLAFQYGSTIWQDTSGAIAASTGWRPFNWKIKGFYRNPLSTSAWTGQIVLGSPLQPTSVLGYGKFTAADLYNFSMFALGTSSSGNITMGLFAGHSALSADLAISGAVTVRIYG